MAKFKKHIASARVLCPNIEKLIILCGLRCRDYRIWNDEFGNSLKLTTKRIIKSKERILSYDLLFKSDIETVIGHSYWGYFTDRYYAFICKRTGRLRVFDKDCLPLVGSLKLGFKVLSEISGSYVEVGPMEGSIDGERFICGEFPMDLPQWVNEKVIQLVKR